MIGDTGALGPRGYGISWVICHYRNEEEEQMVEPEYALSNSGQSLEDSQTHSRRSRLFRKRVSEISSEKDIF